MTDLCRFPDCRRAPASPGQSRCEAHRLRWNPALPAEPTPTGWVQRALAGKLPPKVMS